MGLGKIIRGRTILIIRSLDFQALDLVGLRVSIPCVAEERYLLIDADNMLSLNSCESVSIRGF